MDWGVGNDDGGTGGGEGCICRVDDDVGAAAAMANCLNQEYLNSRITDERRKSNNTNRRSKRAINILQDAASLSDAEHDEMHIEI